MTDLEPLEEASNIVLTTNFYYLITLRLIAIDNSLMTCLFISD